MTFQKEPFYTFKEYIGQYFSSPVQKVSVNAGNTCPNRDGTKGYGGCTYCNVSSFSPAYTMSKSSISDQVENGISFFSHKKINPSFLVYFQSYSNSYGSLQYLKKQFEEALSNTKIKGLIIGTRPDCVTTELMEILQRISEKHYVGIELGIESTLNRTLKKINRCHTYEETLDAFELVKKYNVHTGGHIIIGLPGETSENIISHAKKISCLPIHTLKIHHLQIIRQTIMDFQYKKNKNDFSFRSPEEYIQLMSEFLTWLRPDIAVERFISQAPGEMLIAPNWNGIKNFQITHKIREYMQSVKKYQGMNLSHFECISTPEKIIRTPEF